MNQSTSQTPPPPQGNWLRVQTDGTNNGTKVLLPDNSELKIKNCIVLIRARHIEEVKCDFYMGTPGLRLTMDGTKESGLFFDNQRIRGVCELSVPPQRGTSFIEPDMLVRIRFEPAGSMSHKAEHSHSVAACAKRFGGGAPVSPLPALEKRLRGQMAAIIERCTDSEQVNALFALIELGTPRLGCATTGQLLQELAVRAEIHGYASHGINIAGAMPVQCVSEALARLRVLAQQSGWVHYRTIDENSSHVAVKVEAEAHAHSHED